MKEEQARNVRSLRHSGGRKLANKALQIIIKKQSALAPSTAVIKQARQMTAKVILNPQGSTVWTQAGKNMLERFAHSALSEWGRAVR